MSEMEYSDEAVELDPEVMTSGEVFDEMMAFSPEERVRTLEIAKDLGEFDMSTHSGRMEYFSLRAEAGDPDGGSHAWREWLKRS
jgi:hypothetical protein